MGLGPSKKKIKEILQLSCTGENSPINQTYIKCQHNQNDVGNIGGNSFISSTQVDQSQSYSSDSSGIYDTSSIVVYPISSKSTLFTNPEMYPYCCVGTLKVKFPKSDDFYYYTCFLIDANVVCTLASNLTNIEYGGDATEIYTSFSKDKIKPNNVKKHDQFGKQDSQREVDIAVLYYESYVFDQFFGVKIDNVEQYLNSLFIISSMGLKEATEGQEQPSNEGSQFPDIQPSEIHSINVGADVKMDRESNGEKLVRAYGSPIFYKDFNTDVYVYGMLGNDAAMQKITDSALTFLKDAVNKGRNLVKKDGKNIEEDKITKLDLSRNDFGPLDIKYLSEFDLKNLLYLDLSSNSIKPQGAYYLSQGKYPYLRTLNLNFNEIGDEGISHISNAIFTSLEQLFLFHNNISHTGVSYLCKADFIPNLVILSLSENPQITDEGCKHIKENKNWKNLTILNLNRTGLTDAAVKLLMDSTMHNLRKIHLIGNSFTAAVNAEFSSWSLGGLMIEYDDKNKKKKRKKKEQASA